MLLRPALPFAAAACAALLLAACGGGGSDSPAPPPPVQANVAISQANEQQVASAVANSVVTVGDFAVTTPVSSGERVSAAAKKSGGALPMAVRAGSLAETLQRMSVDAVLAPIADEVREKFLAVTPLAVVPGACPLGGSLDITVIDADRSGTLSGGDTATISFLACRPEAGVLINGVVNVTYTTVSVTQTARTATATVSYSNLSATAPEGNFSLNGPLTLSVTEEGSRITAQLVVGAGGLTSTVTSTVLNYSETLTLGAGLTLRSTEDAAGNLPGGGTGLLFTSEIDGAISSSRLGNPSGTILVDTVTPFQTVGGNLYPTVGQVVVTGAAGSKLRMTAISATQVRIEVDVAGDGTYERNTVYNWSQLI